MVAQKGYGRSKSTNFKDIEAEVHEAFDATTKKSKQALVPHDSNPAVRDSRGSGFGSSSRVGSFGGGRIDSSTLSSYEAEKENRKKAAEKEFVYNTTDWGQTAIRNFAVNSDFPQAAGITNYLQLLKQSPKGIEYERYTAAEQDAEKAQRIEEITNWAKENGRSPILSSLYGKDTNGAFSISSGISLITAPFQGADYVLDALETAYVGAPLPSSEPDFTETTQALREGVSQDMTKTGQFVYHTAMSAADSAIAGWLGGGSISGGIILGMGAASNTAHDIMDRGGTEEQALIGGAVSGIIEGVFEKLSLGQLDAIKYLPADTAKSILGNLAKSVVTNGGEEFTTELASIIFDTIFMGELSTYEMTVQGYLAQGHSEASAKRLANLDLLARLGESAASGALMGVLFGGGASSNSYYRSRLAAQGEARLRTKEMPTPGQLDAMNLSESEARGAMVLLDAEQFDETRNSSTRAEYNNPDKEIATASPTFANSKDILYQNSKRIVPISGYEDVVVHGDMYGFVFKNSDGVESTVSVREFAGILKESGLYGGGNIRLISCETGKTGSVTAQGLANELGVNILAPTDVVYIYPDGKMIVSSDGFTNDGEWVVFEPRLSVYGGEK